MQLRCASALYWVSLRINSPAGLRYFKCCSLALRRKTEKGSKTQLSTRCSHSANTATQGWVQPTGALEGFEWAHRRPARSFWSQRQQGLRCLPIANSRAVRQPASLGRGRMRPFGRHRREGEPRGPVKCQGGMAVGDAIATNQVKNAIDPHGQHPRPPPRQSSLHRRDPTRRYLSIHPTADQGAQGHAQPSIAPASIASNAQNDAPICPFLY